MVCEDQRLSGAGSEKGEEAKNRVCWLGFSARKKNSDFMVHVLSQLPSTFKTGE